MDQAVLAAVLPSLETAAITFVLWKVIDWTKVGIEEAIALFILILCFWQAHFH